MLCLESNSIPDEIGHIQGGMAIDKYKISDDYLRGISLTEFSGFFFFFAKMKIRMSHKNYNHSSYLI